MYAAPAACGIAPLEATKCYRRDVKTRLECAIETADIPETVVERDFADREMSPFWIFQIGTAALEAAHTNPPRGRNSLAHEQSIDIARTDQISPRQRTQR